jgi:hypothetical protein
MLSMRFAPRCSEGWRRLSIVIFCCVVGVLMVREVLAYGASLNASYALCYNQAYSNTCQSSDDACHQKQRSEYAKCFEVFAPSTKTRLEEYSVEAVFALLCGFASFFATRTVGRVVGGFKPAQSSPS